MALKVCEKCGKAISDTDAFCPHCASPILKKETPLERKLERKKGRGKLSKIDALKKSKPLPFDPTEIPALQGRKLVKTSPAGRALGILSFIFGVIAILLTATMPFVNMFLMTQRDFNEEAQMAYDVWSIFPVAFLSLVGVVFAWIALVKKKPIALAIVGMVLNVISLVIDLVLMFFPCYTTFLLLWFLGIYGGAGG